MYINFGPRRRPRVRSEVKNFNARLLSLDSSLLAIRLKRYIVAAINLNRFLDKREREEGSTFEYAFVSSLIIVRRNDGNKKKSKKKNKIYSYS